MSSEVTFQDAVLELADAELHPNLHDYCAAKIGQWADYVLGSHGMEGAVEESLLDRNYQGAMNQLENLDSGENYDPAVLGEYLHFVGEIDEMQEKSGLEAEESDFSGIKANIIPEDYRFGR